MKLEKKLNLLDVFSISAGAMISSGIFILPGLAFLRCGPSLFLAYLFAGILALVGALSITELSSAMPKAGGSYYFIKRSFGPYAGTLSGFLSWADISLKSSFAVIGIAQTIHIFTGTGIIVLSFAVLIFFLLINLTGIKIAGKFQAFIVLPLLGILFYYIITGFSSLNVDNFHNFMPYGFDAVLSTSGFVFIAYGGLLSTASISEEVRNPKKNIPLGMLLSIIAVLFIYTFISFLITGTLDPGVLASSLTPLADSAAVTGQKAGYLLIAAAGMLAFISTVNAGILASSRFPLALARDRLIPAIFASLTPKKKNPAAAIILTGIMMSASFFLPLEELVKAASTASIIIYILVHLSTIILKEGRVQNYKPSFIVPLYPWPQLVSIAVFFFMLSRMGLRTALTSLIFLAAVSLVYLFYGKKKHDGTAALAHLVERFFIKKKAGSKLENELKQVIIERDQIIEDRFDLLVKNAAIIDINQKMNTTELFYFASSQLDKKLGTGSSILFNLFMAREKSSSTVLTDFIAVPHITVKGKNIFELMIIRNKRGITFSADNPAVKAVFLTASSPDERNFYLKALSALAQIVHSPDFEDKWLNTKTVENIRDLIHLSERQRFT